MAENELLEIITEYFKEKIFENHKINSLKTHSKLKSYKINPIIVKYLSKILDDNFTPIGIAKALYYPRILGTSINTSFGTRIQNMFVELGLAQGSLIKGMDIEFNDKIDKRKKWCQLKSGPNTINSEDVNPLLKKFTTVTNLARTNSMNLNNSDLILGVEFWHRLTGYENFYNKLVSNLDQMILNLETEDFFKKGYKALAKEIEDSDLFDFE